MRKINILVIRLLICIASAGVTLYLLTERQNSLIEVRIALPVITKEVRRLREENLHYQYEIDRFENPVHLIELSRKPEFGHLKFPHTEDIISINEENNTHGKGQ